MATSNRHQSGRGIQVRTVRRPAQSSSSSTSYQRTQSGSSRSSNARSNRTSKPSARYRKALSSRKVGHGGDFVKDDDAGRQFENRVLEVYAPAETVNETVRQIPLGEQAKLEGDTFQLPTLSSICLEVISSHFDTHVLPTEFSTKDGAGTSDKKNKHVAKRSKGILGIPIAGYDEERDADFMPSSDEERVRKKQIAPKQRRQRAREQYVQEQRNAFDLEFLPPRLTLKLQELLERKAPRLLTLNVLSTYFLNPAKVLDAHAFRALAIVGGIPAEDIVRLYRRLIAPSFNDDGTTFSAPTIVRPNAVTTLRSIHLQAFTRLTSRQIEPFLNEAVSLEEICLRGCVNITSEAIGKLVKTCGSTLRKVNVNWTSVGLSGVDFLVRGAPNLEELKVAHVQGLNDVSVPAMMSKATQDTVEQGFVPLAKLRKLKLNGTQVGIAAVGTLLKHCGAQIQTLDIGSTRVGGVGCMEILLMALGYERQDQSGLHTTNSALSKLNLSRLEIPEVDLMHFVRAIPSFSVLRNINLNYIQPLKGGSSSGLSNAMLALLFESIAQRSQSSSSPDKYVFDRIGVATGSPTARPLLPGLFQIVVEGESRKIVRSLNLSGLDLSKQDAEPYGVITKLPDGSIREILAMYSDETAVAGDIAFCPLNVETLDLSGCKLPSQFAWQRLGVDGRLRSVDLSGTAVGKDSIDDLIRTNPCLAMMDLTGCRSIPVRQRRNYFSAFDENDAESE